MEMPDPARRWQERIDRTFPHGALVTVPDAAKHAFPVPRPVVVAMHGLNPVVMLDIPGYGRNFSYEILGWDQEQAEPCTLVRVTVVAEEGDDEVLLWSSNISQAQAEAIAPDRRASLRLSAEGRAFKGPRWFGEEQ